MAGGPGFAQVEDDGGAHGVLIDEAARGSRCVVIHHVMAFDVLDEVLQGVGCHGAAEAVAHRLECFQRLQANALWQDRYGGAVCNGDRLGCRDHGLGLDVLDGFFAQRHAVSSFW